MRLTLGRHYFSSSITFEDRLDGRVISAINGPYAKSVWYFLKVMSHKIPPVLVFVPGLKIGRFVVGRCFVGVKEFERCETTP